eukprot:1790623-Rhodomonas_salina.2
MNTFRNLGSDSRFFLGPTSPDGNFHAEIFIGLMNRQAGESFVVDEEALDRLRFSRGEVVCSNCTLGVVDGQPSPAVELIEVIQENEHAMLGLRKKGTIITVSQGSRGDAGLMLVAML